MKPVLYSVLFVSSYLQNVLASYNYEEYHLESFGLCDTEVHIYIRRWKAAILKLGYKSENNSSPARGRIHGCKISVTTHEDFGLAAVIENMDIRATLNKQTNGWVCHGDFVRMSTSGKSGFVKFLDGVFPGTWFKSKKTEELCGSRKNRKIFTEVGTSANVLFTPANNLEVFFHQRKKIPANNSFVIVITAFKNKENEKDCQGMYKCREQDNYCFDPSYKCDEHFNCAFPSGGEDELQCIGKEVHHRNFSTTTIIISTLASMVGAGLIIFCLFTIIMQAKSRNATPSGTPAPPTGLASDASAPPLQRQHTLPRYEAVVMSDLNQSWKSSAPPSPEMGEFPPTYQALFPDGPPKDLETENTHTEEQTTTTQAAAS